MKASATFKNLLLIFHMDLLLVRFHHQIINITFQDFVKHVTENGCHHGLLVCCPNILQIERHYCIKLADGCLKNSFKSIFWGHLDLIVATKANHEGEHAVADS